MVDLGEVYLPKKQPTRLPRFPIAPSQEPAPVFEPGEEGSPKAEASIPECAPRAERRGPLSHLNNCKIVSRSLSGFAQAGSVRAPSPARGPRGRTAKQQAMKGEGCQWGFACYCCGLPLMRRRQWRGGSKAAAQAVECRARSHIVQLPRSCHVPGRALFVRLARSARRGRKSRMKRCAGGATGPAEATLLLSCQVAPHGVYPGRHRGAQDVRAVLGGD